MNTSPTPTAPTALRLWMQAASPEERESLAAAIGSSVGQLYQYAGGHRNASAERAGRIEAATEQMHRASRGRLPRLYRTDLAEACRSCAYARRCVSPASEFPLSGAE
jgi:DNA-binding transcriptional regulator YdaS (Cro superfamily)